MNETSPTDATTVVELTPTGRAAVAVLLVAGPRAVEAVEACFAAGSGRRLADLPPGRIVVGRWGGATGEQLVVCRRSDTRVEVHCHGGPAAVRAVIDSLVARGCAHSRWEDWLPGAEADPVRVAARLALADAPTARTAAVLVDQYEGTLAAAIRRAHDALLADRWPEASAAIDAILAWSKLGRHLTAPWRVVLVGRTNVGKSSLINALAGYTRAIVCALPGTTRDVVTLATAIDGWPVELADTAGTGPIGDELDAAAARHAAAAQEGADLVVAVEEASESANLELGRRSALPQAPGGAELGAHCARPQPPEARVTRTLRVVNKVDLVASRDQLTSVADAESTGAVLTSALTGEGMAELAAAIGRRLVPSAPTPGTAVPFTEAQVTSLAAARAAVERRDRQAAAAALSEWLNRKRR